MVDEGIARPGGLSYLEIPASDPGASAAFYESVVGWRIEWRGADDARFADRTGHLIGRWVKGRPAREPGFVPYIYVTDVAFAVTRVAVSGGAVVEGPRPEGDILVATVRDPAGNVIGLWQAA